MKRGEQADFKKKKKGDFLSFLCLFLFSYTVINFFKGVCVGGGEGGWVEGRGRELCSCLIPFFFTFKFVWEVYFQLFGFFFFNFFFFYFYLPTFFFASLLTCYLPRIKNFTCAYIAYFFACSSRFCDFLVGAQL